MSKLKVLMQLIFFVTFKPYYTRDFRGYKIQGLQCNTPHPKIVLKKSDETWLMYCLSEQPYFLMTSGICDVTLENMTIDSTLGKKSILFLRLLTEFQNDFFNLVFTI